MKKLIAKVVGSRLLNEGRKRDQYELGNNEWHI